MSNLAVLRRVTLFADLSDNELAEVEAIARKRSFRKHEVIFHSQEPGSALFILTRGRVKVSINDRQGREIILRILEAGDFFGEMSLLDGEYRSATVTTLEPCQALIIFRDRFSEFIPRHPNVVMKMLTMLSRRLRKANEKIGRLAFADAHEKVASVLTELMEERKVPLSIGAELPLSLTRTELANLAGISRETFTRVMADFQRDSVLRVERRRIVVINPGKLRREATRSVFV